MDNIDGLTEIFIVDNLCLESKVVRGLGSNKREKKTLINMLELTMMI